MPWTPEERTEVLGTFTRMVEWNANQRFPTAPPFSGTGLQWPLAARGANRALERSPIYISRFLSQGLNNPEIVAGLDKLERALTAEAHKRQAKSNRSKNSPILPATWDYSSLEAAFRKSDPGAKEIRHHLLRDCLFQGLVNGASAAAFDSTLRVAVGFLQGANFYRPISHKQHMKDVLVGLDHGEWTHLLQWYLIANDRTRPPTEPAPAEAFEYLGLQGQWQLQEKAPASTSWGPNLWQVCCDRVAPYYHLNVPRAATRPAANGSAQVDALDDFRCPDMLHIALCGFAPVRGPALSFPAGRPKISFYATNARWVTSRQKWPLLCVLLRLRLEKREAELTTAGAYSNDFAWAKQVAPRVSKNALWSAWVDVTASNTPIQPGRASGPTPTTEFLQNLGGSTTGTWALDPDWRLPTYRAATPPPQWVKDELKTQVLTTLFDELRKRLEFRDAGKAASVLYAWRKAAEPPTAANQNQVAAPPATDHHLAWAALPAVDKQQIMTTVATGLLP